jgi:succinoglycan biosynthesis protein ExoO
MSSRPAPLVSVIMANRNGAAFLAEAVRSVLRQTLVDLELIVVDDASDDDSVQIVGRFRAEDRRVVLVEQPVPSGPAAARNAGLQLASGGWIAVVDSDDYVHPDRFRRLLEFAETARADIVADDLVVFHDDGAEKPRLFLRGAMARGPVEVTAAAWIGSDTLYGRTPPLGYLKPLIRAEALAGTRYDERLFNGEDFNLIARLLIAGRRMLTTPEPMYFYRRRSGSTSHRLRPGHLRAIEATDADLRALAAGRAPVLRALDRRLADQRTVYAFEGWADAIKARDPATAARIAAARPSVLRLAGDRVLRRLFRRARPAAAAGSAGRPRELVVLSRQRLVGAVSGSSAYLLSLCRALRERGWRIRFVGPSPGAFGRRPFFRLRPELELFDSYVVRGGVRVGRRLLSRDPSVWAHGLAGALEQKLVKAGLLRAGRLKPAPYAVALPATRQDMLFVARAVSGGADAVLADYAFLAPLVPYALVPGAPSAILMHDLFSSRPAQFDREGARDSVARLSPTDEFRLLAQADAVVAIQRDEAETVRLRLPATPVLLAPMAVRAVDAPQPGTGPELLFVGSNTAPNVLGLTWFLEQVWPLLKRDRPEARLLVAGDVDRVVAKGPPDVRFLGLVPDLAPLYAAAAVVISPLTAGSGLKIKLVEAMSRGKAVVATGVTVQGVEELVREAVAVADDPGEFARETAALLGDPGLRARRGALALEIARSSFGAEACYGDVVRFFDRREARLPQVLSRIRVGELM